MFRTPIDFPKATFNIDHPQSILALGSCFSQNIGERMAAAKFPVSINPFGTLFDPISIHAIFDMANLESKEEELIFYQGYWHAVKYHGSFKHKDKALLLEKIRQSKEHLINYLKTSDILMLTYGTAHVWKTIEKNELICTEVVANDVDSSAALTKSSEKKPKQARKKIANINLDTTGRFSFVIVF